MNALLQRLSALRLPNSYRWWVLLGLAVFVYFLLRQVPAHWGAFAFTRGTGLALSGISGSFWQGRASLASLRLPSGQELALGEFTWQLKPWSLLSLSPCAALVTQMDNQSFSGDVCVSLSGSVKVREAEASFPVGLLPARLPFPVAGQLSLHLQELQLRGNVLLKLAGKLSWAQAQANNGSQWIELGSFGAELQDDGNNGINAKVFDLAGPVGVNLQVELKAPAGGRAQGQLLMAPEFVQAARAADLLAMVAQEGDKAEDGRVRYQVDMNL